jgi:hypothetical protein
MILERKSVAHNWINRLSHLGWLRITFCVRSYYGISIDGINTTQRGINNVTLTDQFMFAPNHSPGSPRWTVFRLANRPPLLSQRYRGGRFSAVPLVGYSHGCDPLNESRPLAEGEGIGAADSREQPVKHSYRISGTKRGSVRGMFSCNHSTYPAPVSGTSRAMHDPRHRCRG